MTQQTPAPAAGSGRAAEVESANIECYDDYYYKPSWWFRLRYDTEMKRQACLHLLRRAGVTLRDKRILEIGFGNGAVLLSADPSCSIHGIEISRSALEVTAERARKRGYRKVDLRPPSGSALPFPDRSMDVVIASHVLEHLGDDAAMLREIERVLAPAGCAVILVPINEKFEEPKHVRRYTSDSLTRLAGECGLKPVVLAESEVLYRLIEGFYFRGYNTSWPVIGPFIVAAFNIPLALLPYAVHRGIERALLALGVPPMQTGCVLRRA